MPRIAYIILFLVVAMVPVIFFALLSKAPTTQAKGTSGYRGYYSRGPSFIFYNHHDWDGGSRGRGYSSGGFQGGGFRSGK